MCLESEKFVSIWTKGKLGYLIVLLTLFYNKVYRKSKFLDATVDKT